MKRSSVRKALNIIKQNKHISITVPNPIEMLKFRVGQMGAEVKVLHKTCF